MSEKFPKDWKIKPLGSFIKNIGDGGTPSTSDQSNFGGGIPWIVISDIQREIWKTKTTLSEKGLKKSSSKLWKPQTVILSTGATIGQVGIAKTKLATKQGITGIECDDNLLPEYLYYFLKNNKHLLLSLSQGSTIEEIRAPTLVKLNVSIPPLPEQKKIASILTSVDEVIEKTQSQINKLQDLKKGTMNELLTRGIGHIEFKDSELGKIPKGWEISDLKSLVVSHNSGIYKKKSEYGNGYNILGVSDLYSCHIVDGQIFRKVPLTDEEVLEFSLKKGDLVYGESSLVREGIAKTVCVSENGEGTIFAWHTRRFSVSDNMDSIFLNYFLSSNISRTYLTKVATQTALTGITTKDYFGVKVVIPSFKEQQQIVTILSSIDNHIEKKQRKLQKNQYLKKSLMQDLLTGKVRVSVN